MTFLTLISDITGWLYFFAWSISFYPQVLLNYRRKETSGLSCEFLWYNALGFGVYTVYSQVKYCAQPEGADEVRVNDLIFCYHALGICTFTLCQSMWYGSDAFQIKTPHDTILILLLLAVTITLLLLSAGVIPLVDEDYSLVAVFGAVKIIISMIKYVPQAVLNFHRKSTIGWSIGNIWLDFSGGILSFTQIFIDAMVTNSWEPLFGNPTKLGLSLVSMAFDIFFLTQHYIVYKNHNSDDRPLLSDQEAMEIDMLVVNSSEDSPLAHTQEGRRSSLPLNGGDDAHDSNGNTESKGIGSSTTITSTLVAKENKDETDTKENVEDRRRG